jgi:uncharacterized membrane protein
MQHKNQFKLIVMTAVLLIAIAGIWLSSATPASAQCGSQASSCKNCHEVQGEYPVNNDGTGWHQSHAFGDFCYICHAGNNQAQDKAEAHTGMVSPLSDIKASCMQCHPSDLEERAQVYATTLGVDINTGNSDSGASDPGESTAAVSSGIGLMAPTELEVNDPNLVDYVQRYNELVLGENPINKGNLIVGALIGLVALGGGAFVLYNEGWVGVDYEKVDEYPAEIVALLPKLEHLAPPERRKLQRMLEDPQQVAKALSQLTDLKEPAA